MPWGVTWLQAITDALGAVLWSPVMLACFLGTGLYFTLRSRFFQLHPAVLRDTFADRKGSSLKTLSAALGACMGTGNIAGVGTALVTGGPGALFWMCLSAFLGMMTSFAETVLAVKFRSTHADGTCFGGAMQVLEKGLGMKKCAAVYAFLLTASSFGIGNMAQVNAAADALHMAFGVPPVAVGAVFCVLIALTVCGGIRRITAVTEKAVPLLSALFFLSALAALWMHGNALGGAVRLVFVSAFSPQSVLGGACGYSVRQAMRMGVTRGVFSNEAGLGSTAVIHASADTDSAVRQGLWGIVEVFLDTVLMCSVTGLVILTSGVYPTDTNGASLFADALCTSFGKAGSALTAVTLALLGFASLTGWSYCGERGVAYLFGEKRLPVYRVLYAAVAFFGSFLRLDTVFALSDILNCLMALPNLLSLWLLSGTVLRELRMYKSNRNCQHLPYQRRSDVHDPCCRDRFHVHTVGDRLVGLRRRFR